MVNASSELSKSQLGLQGVLLRTLVLIIVIAIRLAPVIVYLLVLKRTLKRYKPVSDSIGTNPEAFVHLVHVS